MSETTLTGIRRGDISEDSPALREFQQSELTKDADWWKEGVVIYWTNEAAARFRATREEPIPAPEPPAEGSTIHTLKAVKLARNSFFVACGSPHEEGCCIHVKLAKKGSGKKFLGKLIKVEQTGDTYRQIR